MGRTHYPKHMWEVATNQAKDHNPNRIDLAIAADGGDAVAMATTNDWIVTSEGVFVIVSCTQETGVQVKKVIPLIEE